LFWLRQHALAPVRASFAIICSKTALPLAKAHQPSRVPLLLMWQVVGFQGLSQDRACSSLTLRAQSLELIFGDDLE